MFRSSERMFPSRVVTPSNEGSVRKADILYVGCSNRVAYRRLLRRHDNPNEEVFLVAQSCYRAYKSATQAVPNSSSTAKYKKQILASLQQVIQTFRKN